MWLKNCVPLWQNRFIFVKQMLQKCFNIIISSFLLCSTISIAQNDSIKNQKCKRISLISTSAIIAGGTLTYLNQAWYKQYSTGAFHTFNDNKEWLQMDKVGHVWSTYNSSRLMMDAFDWAGYSKKQKLMYGGTMGFVYMLGIEAMDGFSSGWGFSGGDVLANTLGTGIAISQEALWNKQHVFIKYSYRESGLATYNPSLLGKTFSEKLLKDYNAQVYWVSFSPFSFIKSENKFPKWLAISLGYGASGMIRARENFIYYYSTSGPEVYYYLQTERFRDFYVSLDIDFTKIKTKSKALKTIFTLINTVKVPLPTVGFNKYGSTFYWYR